VSVIIEYDLGRLEQYKADISDIPEASGSVTWYVDGRNMKCAKIGIGQREYEAFKVDNRYIILETVSNASEATYYYVNSGTYLIHDGKAEVSPDGLDPAILTTLKGFKPRK
jgi:hypothetical protein